MQAKEYYEANNCISLYKVWLEKQYWSIRFLSKSKWFAVKLLDGSKQSRQFNTEILRFKKVDKFKTI